MGVKTSLTVWREVWDFFGDYKRRAIYVLIMLVLASFFEAVSIGLLMPMLDLIINENTDSILGTILLSFFGDNSTKDALAIILIVFLLFIVLKNVFVLIKVNLQGKFSFGLLGYWMTALMGKYVRSDYNYILDNQQGVLINNVLVESEKCRCCLSFITKFVSSIVLIVFMVSVMLITSWQITLYFAIISGVVAGVSNRFTSGFSRSIGDRKIKYSRGVSNSVSEGISLVKQIKVLGSEDRVTSDFNAEMAKYIQTLTSFFVISRVPPSVAEVLNVTAIVSAAIFSLFYTSISIKDLIPIIAVFVVIGSRLSIQIGQLINSKMEILSNLQSLRNVHALINHDIETENLEKGEVCVGVSENIDIKNVSFYYDKSKVIFYNLNFTIPKGKLVFLIGESGSGKSCIVDILLRLQQPKSGKVLSGSYDINHYSKSSWRSKIGYVSQDVLLFNKSIRQNILDGGLHASEEDIYEVLKRVDAYEYVMALPNGLDTIVGDRGAKLSGGQRQRLSLARAIMRDVDFLILDEATSAMDHQLEEKIIEEIKLNFSRKTVLFITHRLSTAVHADVVYKLDKGEVELITKTGLDKLRGS
jgi:ABC-type multidrug transport system fused ATPase/permease subunit